MSRQQELQTLFESILGSRNVYFQPPETVKLKYPCIIYSRDIIRNLNANDKPYKINEGFSVTYIDKDPVSEIPMVLASLPLCSFDRHYVADNLNHDVFTIF